jgi:hypothetical protein
MPMFDQIFLAHLNFHLGLVFLQAELGVLLEPPWRNLTLTNPAQNGQRRGMVLWIIQT